MKPTEKTRNLGKLKVPDDGYSIRQLVDEISSMNELKPTKKFRSQVELALRRGVDFGILVKVKNRYRFDPEASASKLNKKFEKPKQTRVKSKRLTKKKKRQQQHQHSTKSSSSSSTSTKNQTPRVPRPTVPPPPDWTPKPRNLLEEPVTKIIKPLRKKR